MQPFFTGSQLLTLELIKLCLFKTFISCGRIFFMKNFLFVFLTCLFVNQNLLSADFEKFSFHVTEKTLENGRMYGYTDEYIIRDWLKISYPI